jgi:hypothetical protein
VPEHLLVTSSDDLTAALEDAERVLDPPVPVRVRWNGEWHSPAMLHGWQPSEDRGAGWLGCVEHRREIAPGFGFAVGRGTPVWNIERVDAGLEHRTSGNASPSADEAAPVVVTLWRAAAAPG